MISHVVDQIRDAYLAAADPGEVKPSFGFGAPAAAEFKSIPSVVFVPMSEKLDPAKKRGDEPGAIALRRVTCVARIWGKDVDDCEDIAARLVDAAREAIPGGFELGDAEWDTAGKVQRGQVFALAFVFLIEMTRRPATTAPVTTAPITASVDALEIGA